MAAASGASSWAIAVAAASGASSWAMAVLVGRGHAAAGGADVGGAGAIAPWWAALGEAARGVVRVVVSASWSQGASIDGGCTGVVVSVDGGCTGVVVSVDGGCTGEQEAGVLGVIAPPAPPPAPPTTAPPTTAPPRPPISLARSFARWIGGFRRPADDARAAGFKRERTCGERRAPW